jgi:CDP-2,3-bis-(O-geranylgeranyl)-sn-glycerol synthase
MNPLLVKLWYFLPAAFGNTAPVLTRWGPLRKIPNRPLDFGVKLPDGNRLFGDGKTFFGTFLGISAGTIFGALQGHLFLGFVLASGALLGDLVAAFFKRRFGLPRGAPVPILDQLDMIAGAVLLTWPLGFFNWTAAELLVLCVITIPIHRLLGVIGHGMQMKREPW